jgi:molybdopterin synthase catalytic subunit
LKKWSLERIAVIHRLGQVAIGESSIMISVSSSHRLEAFRACEEVLENIKSSTEIWKKVSNKRLSLSGINDKQEQYKEAALWKANARTS